MVWVWLFHHFYEKPMMMTSQKSLFWMKKSFFLVSSKLTGGIMRSGGTFELFIWLWVNDYS